MCMSRVAGCRITVLHLLCSQVPGCSTDDEHLLNVESRTVPTRQRGTKEESKRSAALERTPLSPSVTPAPDAGGQETGITWVLSRRTGPYLQPRKLRSAVPRNGSHAGTPELSLSTRTSTITCSRCTVPCSLSPSPACVSPNVLILLRRCGNGERVRSRVFWTLWFLRTSTTRPHVVLVDGPCPGHDGLIECQRHFRCV